MFVNSSPLVGPYQIDLSHLIIFSDLWGYYIGLKWVFGWNFWEFMQARDENVRRD